MNREYMLNDYVKENTDNNNSFDYITNYANTLKENLAGTKNINQVIIEVSKFIENNKVPSEFEKELKSILNGFDENTDTYTARTRIENFLNNNMYAYEKDFNKSNEAVNEIKEDLIDAANRKLDNVNISLKGNNSEVIDNIKDEDDVYRIKNNVDTTYDYFKDREEIIGKQDEVKNTEVSLDVINNVVESSRDNVILNEALNNEEKGLNKANLIEANPDGTVELKGDSNNQDSINFALMMATVLSTNNNVFNTKYNLDMKFIKEKADISQFKIVFGNFPVTNHPENRLDPVIISQIEEQAKSYKSNVDYSYLLDDASPELATAFEIINNNIFDNEGAFKMAVKNDDGNIDMRFGMDQNYQNIASAFNENGAVLTGATEDYEVVDVNDTVPGEQLSTLNGTNETLAKEKEINNKITNGVQLTYGIYPINNPNNEAANASHIFLMVVTVANIVLLGIYILMTFIK